MHVVHTYITHVSVTAQVSDVLDVLLLNDEIRVNVFLYFFNDFFVILNVGY